MTYMTYYVRRADVGLLGDLRSYNVNPLRGLLRNLGGPPLGVNVYFTHKAHAAPAALAQPLF
jgi:hypothetical protein